MVVLHSEDANPPPDNKRDYPVAECVEKQHRNHRTGATGQAEQHPCFAGNPRWPTEQPRYGRVRIRVTQRDHGTGSRDTNGHEQHQPKHHHASRMMVSPHAAQPPSHAVGVVPYASREAVPAPAVPVARLAGPSHVAGVFLTEPLCTESVSSAGMNEQPGESVPDAPVAEVPAVVGFDAADAELPAQPLHRDTHSGNALVTANGLVWNDFEDTWYGPVE